ncbi:aldehyde dehydrogenase family protein [Chryseobacterium salipaludis]|uniref:aldehyde dehydrogenase family protein n=1 Tax=Chryseobacterium TaxID=59732 RepID=UPI002B1CB662|nr:aldehyde dehydrogenase family protein [Planobacterium sp. JC490]
MQAEIFGPLLPILTYKDFRDALNLISEKPAPLSAYLFNNDKKEQEQFINNVRFGGGCINDTIMHLSNPNLPFGGVGNSGLGNYHGKFGFETFSHQKGVLKRATWGEPNLKYPPYAQKKFSWIRKLLG